MKNIEDMAPKEAFWRGIKRVSIFSLAGLSITSCVFGLPMELMVAEFIAASAVLVSYRKAASAEQKPVHPAPNARLLASNVPRGG